MTSAIVLAIMRSLMNFAVKVRVHRAIRKLKQSLERDELWIRLNIIFLGTPVTFLFWHTYSVVKRTLNGESISAARGLLEKQSKCEVAGQGNNDE